MYSHDDLIAFISQWTVSVFPVRMSQVMYDFTEFLGHRVRVDKKELVDALIKAGYLVDVNTNLITH
jgi:hypothetical protein